MKCMAFIINPMGNKSSVPSVKLNDDVPEVCELNVAVIVVLAFTVTIQLTDTLQPPPFHPAKADPAAGVAVRVTEVPLP